MQGTMCRANEQMALLEWFASLLSRTRRRAHLRRPAHWSSNRRNVEHARHTRHQMRQGCCQRRQHMRYAVIPCTLLALPDFRACTSAPVRRQVRACQRAMPCLFHTLSPRFTLHLLRPCILPPSAPLQQRSSKLSVARAPVRHPFRACPSLLCHARVPLRRRTHLDVYPSP